MTKLKKLFALLLSCAMLASLVPGLSFSAAAEGAVGEPELVWDMENVAEDLYAADMAFDVQSNEAGHTNGMVDVTRAEGKGVDGSAAVALTLLPEAAGTLWGTGVYLRMDNDPTAKTDWLGLKQFWFWIDVSEFNDQIKLDLMIDGVHPSADKPMYLYQDGKLTEQLTVQAYGGAKFGRLLLPQGYVGWVGIDAASFRATFGQVQSVAFGIEPSGDVSRFPLSMYVDEFYVVREDTSDSVLHGGGELFNKDIPLSENKLYIDITDVQQKVDGFGASGAWWTTADGTGPFVDKALELLYTDDGIGLNTYRHNVGGSVKDDLSDGGTSQRGRKVPSPLTEDGKYVEDRDIGAYTVLMKLNEMGTVHDFTLFMNSPPSTMTNSGLTYGDTWADSYSNLREDCYEAYARYVVDMVQLYNWCGVPVKYVSPINEPQWDWVGGQEGCHYTAEQAMRLIRLVAQELKDRIAQDPSLAGVKLSVVECANWTDKSYTNYLAYQILGDELLQEMVGHICCHSYSGSADDKKRFVQDLWNMGIKVTLRQTEYGPSYSECDLTMAGAIDVARIMYEDLTILNVDNWSYWLAVSNGSYTDGLMYYNGNSSDLMISKRFYVMGNYSKFVTGATRVGLDEYGMPKNILSSAYVNTEDDALVYVVVNNGKTDETFSFAGLPAGSVAEVYETSWIRDLELRGTMTADNGYTLPAQSVTTFVFKGMDIKAIQSSGHPDNPMGVAANPDFDYDVFRETEPAPTEPAPTEPVADAESPAGFPWGIVAAVGAVVVIGIVAVLVFRKKKKD